MHTNRISVCITTTRHACSLSFWSNEGSVVSCQLSVVRRQASGRLPSRIEPKAKSRGQKKARRMARLMAQHRRATLRIEPKAKSSGTLAY
jgi:hypothetical protein